MDMAVQMERRADRFEVELNLTKCENAALRQMLEDNTKAIKELSEKVGKLDKVPDILGALTKEFASQTEVLQHVVAIAQRTDDANKGEEATKGRTVVSHPSEDAQLTSKKRKEKGKAVISYISVFSF